MAEEHFVGLSTVKQKKPLDRERSHTPGRNLVMKHLTVNEVNASYGFQGEGINS